MMPPDSPERRALKARLKAEAQAPYRGLRRFIYGGVIASGLIGAGVFGLRLLAGYPMGEILPNLALQVAIVALMVGLWRWDRDPS